MRTLVSVSIMFALISGFQYAGADETPVTKEVTLNMNDVFIPETVERGTDAKIVLTGMFPNSCYRWSRSEVTNSNGNRHQVKAMGLVTINTMCLMVLVPYSKQVNLGQLPPGEHTLRFVNGDDTYFDRKLVVQ